MFPFRSLLLPAPHALLTLLLLHAAGVAARNTSAACTCHLLLNAFIGACQYSLPCMLNLIVSIVVSPSK